MEEDEFCLHDRRALLLLKGPSSFILAGKAGSRFPLCVEYGDGEICTTIEKTDIIAVSAPEGGALEPAVMLMELVRAYHVPLLVLPQGIPDRNGSHMWSLPVLRSHCPVASSGDPSGSAPALFIWRTGWHPPVRNHGRDQGRFDAIIRHLPDPHSFTDDWHEGPARRELISEQVPGLIGGFFPFKSCKWGRTDQWFPRIPTGVYRSSRKKIPGLQ